MRVLLNINRLLILSAVLLMAAPVLLYAEDSGVAITHVESATQDNDYVMSADIDYQLSEKTVEALNNGVSLFWTYQFKVQEQRDYLWNKTVLDKSVRYGVQYHALLKLYRVSNISNGTDENFSTLEGALDKLSTLRDYPLIEKDKIADGNQYIASMQITFERDALPLPLRPVAYMNPQWYLSSDWYTWPLKK
ncbi:MAG: DUF4390 domain-containing protein [Gammaproteobacteria bacterium]|nr:DUF4390 domain-containing protein [Gammaproteobacteria bacterium]